MFQEKTLDVRSDRDELREEDWHENEKLTRQSENRSRTKRVFQRKSRTERKRQSRTERKRQSRTKRVLQRESRVKTAQRERDDERSIAIVAIAQKRQSSKCWTTLVRECGHQTQYNHTFGMNSHTCSSQSHDFLYIYTDPNSGPNKHSLNWVESILVNGLDGACLNAGANLPISYLPGIRYLAGPAACLGPLPNDSEWHGIATNNNGFQNCLFRYVAHGQRRVGHRDIVKNDMRDGFKLGGYFESSPPRCSLPPSTDSLRSSANDVSTATPAML